MRLVFETASLSFSSSSMVSSEHILDSLNLTLQKSIGASTNDYRLSENKRCHRRSSSGRRGDKQKQHRWVRQLDDKDIIVLI
ncbi:hypothetical protein TNIN_347871 [Trichonephila inaurata madagascariensis]|uniref:Uncharacterized protein n=1 Tax=Trichonephila inaurata madagascariensis TaxID=2747483 RepID=A0A8X6YF26_9ARAC|nr:hypothetical protein TNIN_347871 [Trichonephila inaurata madagascariensis]